jgi:hypothetical protein
MRFKATLWGVVQVIKACWQKALPERTRHERHPMPLVLGAKSTVLPTKKAQQMPNGCPAHLKTVSDMTQDNSHIPLKELR